MLSGNIFRKYNINGDNIPQKRKGIECKKNPRTIKPKDNLLPDKASNLESSRSNRDVLPVTPSGNMTANV